MSFDAIESSRASGQPITLYLFIYGVGSEDYFAYTDADSPLAVTDPTYGSVIYTPISIDRGKITASGGLDKSNLIVTTAVNTALADLYLVYPPSYVTELIMRQGHVDDDDADFKVCWTGRVLGAQRKGSKAEFTCQPVTTSLLRNGLRRRWQFGCPHALYGPDCKANKPAATYPATAAQVARSRLTLPSGWYGGDGNKFLGGMCEWSLPGGSIERRTILRVENSGTTFLLGGQPRGLTAGHAVNMILGCNHQSGTPAQPTGDCGPLHSNVVNFGGQEYIPFKNPVGLKNNFY